jgi:alanine-glyoxylate transaminase/serine-glyoxylate transaminase/serine-pyruvate transaminase
VRVPEGVDEMKVRRGLLQEHNIEVGGGIGALQGQVWRIGLMGYNSTAQNVLGILFALETELARQGFRAEKGAGVAAAAQSLNAGL